MFKFDFAIDDVDEQVEGSFVPTSESTSDKTDITQDPFAEISLEHLLDALPSLISCSPIPVPLTSGRELFLSRRDLFDARFQLISEGKDIYEEQTSDQTQDKKEGTSALGFIDAPSDLVPGVYEGGLKTWECSLDLVDYLDSLKDGADNVDPHGKRILEIGCGTGVPSIYLLHQIFSSPPQNARETHVRLQDYNASVLELVTFPNILLAWYMSPASSAYRDSSAADPSDADPSDPLPPPDPSTPTELPINASLKSAFLSSLESHGISLKFFSGSWESFDLHHSGAGGIPYDVVLTSETIYRTESLPPLLKLMRSACLGEGDGTERTLEDSVSEKLTISSRAPSYMCLVAAKVLYFGVGGGTSEFVRAVEEGRGQSLGKVMTVWERNLGVGRKVMKVEWANSGV